MKRPVGPSVCRFTVLQTDPEPIYLGDGQTAIHVRTEAWNLVHEDGARADSTCFVGRIEVFWEMIEWALRSDSATIVLVDERVVVDDRTGEPISSLPPDPVEEIGEPSLPLPPGDVEETGVPQLRYLKPAEIDRLDHERPEVSVFDPSVGWWRALRE